MKEKELELIIIVLIWKKKKRILTWELEEEAGEDEVGVEPLKGEEGEGEEDVLE